MFIFIAALYLQVSKMHMNLDIKNVRKLLKTYIENINNKNIIVYFFTIQS